MAAVVAGSPVNTASISDTEYAFLEYRRVAEQQRVDEELIRVNHDASWSYCGPLLLDSSSPNSESALPANFEEFAQATFTGPILPRLLPFLEFLNRFLASSGLHHYFLTVRATTPTGEYDRPRWHTDDLFFANLTDSHLPGTGLGLSSRYKEEKKNKSNERPRQAPSGTSWKICTTLLGPSTLFIPHEHQSLARTTQRLAQASASTDHKCLSIRCVGCASAADQVRDELATKLAACGVQAAGPGECAFFRVGRDSGAVHSEPSMSEGDEGRVFVNVVPGTEEELRVLMGKWGMEFPREWWIGSRHILRSHQ